VRIRVSSDCTADRNDGVFPHDEGRFSCRSCPDRHESASREVTIDNAFVALRPNRTVRWHTHGEIILSLARTWEGDAHMTRAGIVSAPCRAHKRRRGASRHPVSQVGKKRAALGRRAGLAVRLREGGRERAHPAHELDRDAVRTSGGLVRELELQLLGLAGMQRAILGLAREGGDRRRRRRKAAFGDPVLLQLVSFSTPLAATGQSIVMLLISGLTPGAP